MLYVVPREYKGGYLVDARCPGDAKLQAVTQHVAKGFTGAVYEPIAAYLATPGYLMAAYLDYEVVR